MTDTSAGFQRYQISRYPPSDLMNIYKFGVNLRINLTKSKHVVPEMSVHFRRIPTKTV